MYYNITAWMFGAKRQWLPMTTGCVKLNKYPVSNSRVHHKGYRVPVATLAPISLWLYLNLWLILPKSNPIYVYADWWFDMNGFDKTILPAWTGHRVLRAWRRSSSSQTLHNGMCKATIPVTEDRYLASQWREMNTVAQFSSDFEFTLPYTCSVNVL